MRHFLSLKFDYFTNFPIKSNWSLNLKQKIRTPNNNLKKRMCKNIIFFILFTKFLKKVICNNTDLKLKVGVLIQPQRQNIFNYLRAPYKNKLSRNQIYIPRFKVSFVLKFYKLTTPSHDNPYFGNEVISFFSKTVSGFESNILYLNKINITYKSLFKTYWNYNV